ncbi:MAG: hypothetical protein JW384_00485 [Nitrosomonadaceae bacterium]|nr:hypothetical protein [Nitrosomonadaceae bacterium]
MGLDQLPSNLLRSPARILTGPDRDDFIKLGGYIHPLFASQETSIASRPFPGSALLHILGGLVEQTPEIPENLIALLSFGHVEFTAKAFAGDQVSALIEIYPPTPTSSGRNQVIPMNWKLISVPDESIIYVTAQVRMLANGATNEK